MKRVATCIAGLVLSATMSLAAEKTLMHCFAFTPIETASQAEWNAFYKATDELPGKIPGLKRVWYGKLARPLAQNQLKFGDAEARKKMLADKKGTTEFTVVERKNGVCMEFNDQSAFDAYGKSEPHKAWVAVYEKVRVPGTTTYQILPNQ
jgi:hypothetical protein